MRYRFILLLPSTTTRRPVDLEGVGRMAATATDDLLNAWVGARAVERRGLTFGVEQDHFRGLLGCDTGRHQRAVDLAMAAAQLRHEVVHLRIEVRQDRRAQLARAEDVLEQPGAPVAR